MAQYSGEPSSQISPSRRCTFDSPSGGGERSYLLHLPSGHNDRHAAPLILAFDGKKQSAETFEKETSFSNATYNTDTIVVYPQGITVGFTPIRPSNIPDSPLGAMDRGP